MATAHEAMRVRKLSARDVNMTGTRAPSTMPAASALEMKCQILREHVAGFEVGHDQYLRLSCDRRLDALDARRLGTDGVVKGEGAIELAAGDLSAICHLAERGRVDRRGDVWGNGLDRREDCNFRRAETKSGKKIDRVLNDVALRHEIRRDVDGRVGDEQASQDGSGRP